jgi:Flp pilus assembly pilin Flp
MMDLLMRLVWAVRAKSKGQSMTEYALILGAVAVAVYATYTVLGTNITAKVAAVNAALAS